MTEPHPLERLLDDARVEAEVFALRSPPTPRPTLSRRETDSMVTGLSAFPLTPLAGDAEHGSLRVVAAVAEHLDLAPAACLPLPVRGLDEKQRARVARVVDDLGLGRER